MIAFQTTVKNQDANIILSVSGQKNPLLKKELIKGQLFPVMVNNCLHLFVGLGKKEDLSLTELRIQIRKAYLSDYLKDAKNIALTLHEKEENTVIAAIEGIMLGGYVWDKYKSKPKSDTTVKNKNVVIIVEHKKIYDQTIAICQGVNLTRDLVNDNADIVTAPFLEKTVKDLIKGNKNISLEILNERELKKHGLNLHLAVNQGSNKEPKLIIVRYKGDPKKSAYTAIVGKGMTFDTGGLNLKPTGSIETMKIDMGGAAAVCGILKNAINLKIKKNLLFVLGIAENAIGPGAYKPGDVFTGYAGKSVEIGNTDAEGRLVLADALSYIVKNYKPARIIDLATLTGACVVGLGFDYSGLISNNDDLARNLIRASNTTDDRAWRLPNYAEISEYIKSPIADLKNTSSVKGGGACTAGEFLRQFVNDTPWAHLDIAGSCFVEGAQRMYFGPGATGAGVRLVTHHLLYN